MKTNGKNTFTGRLIRTHHRHIADTSQTHRRHIAGTSQTHRRHIADTSQAHRRHIGKGIFFPFISFFSGFYLFMVLKKIELLKFYMILSII